MFSRVNHLYENEVADRLQVLPRDPETLFVYWDTTAELRGMVERYFSSGWGELRKALRIYDVNGMKFYGDEANRSWDIEVHGSASQWFVRGLSPDCTYIVDFGIVTEPNGIFTLMRSTGVKLPPVRPFEDGHIPYVPRSELVGMVKPLWMDRFSGYSLQ